MNIKAFSSLCEQYSVSLMGILLNWTIFLGMLKDFKSGELPEIIVIGPDIDLGSTLKRIEEAQVSPLRKAKWCVVLNGQNDEQTLQRLKQLGVHIFPNGGLSAEILAERLGLRSVKVKQTHIISAVNVKGGSGKTTFITTFADLLARRELRVIVVDADTSDGNIRTAFGLDDELAGLEKLAQDLKQIRKTDISPQALLEKYIHPISDNLHTLLAPAQTITQDHLNPEVTDTILDALLSLRYEMVLVDLAGAIKSTPFIISIIKKPQAMFYMLYHHRAFEHKGFERVKRLLINLGAPLSSLNLVVIGDEAERLSPIALAEIEEKTEFKVHAFLPHDRSINEAQLAGVPLPEFIAKRKEEAGVKKIFIKSPYCEAMETLTEQFVGTIKQ